ncbi:hypothetical protein FF011L_47880 [Roseimaritima multifibrata]|uniref:Uncharacterized protein n=1 Tax=Roseimaritima multifibrata TaxID=1930274 RepID=A0A517MM75_9BACT|nr:hypothetical protein [Roseimaritima multifibrata]QDS95984.1 hypothetical protein FF011L_47880 [Roseimaritima multifibrata]
MFRIIVCSGLSLFMLLSSATAQGKKPKQEATWDYDPYNMLVWVLDTNGDDLTDELRQPLRDYLDYDFSALWRLDLKKAPPIVQVAALRDLQSVQFERLTASDPVLAVRKNHPDAPRIRTALSAGQYVKSIYATADMQKDVLDRAQGILLHPARGRWERMINEALVAMDLNPAKYRAINIAMLDVLEGTSKVDVPLLKKMTQPIIDSTVDMEDGPTAAEVQQGLQKLFQEMELIAEVSNADLHGMRDVIKTEGFPNQDAVLASWAAEGTESLLIPRGMAAELDDPAPKIIPLDIAGLMGENFDNYDKIFIVRIDRQSIPIDVAVMEIDCVMRLPGPIVRKKVLNEQRLVAAIGEAMTASFGPIIRIEDAATKLITGRVRGAGLITDPDSPAAIKVGDLLQPAVRKDDRQGDPLILEALDWAYLKVNKVDGAKLEMELFAGRAGGLQGRKNSRTHRLAFRIRPYYPNTVIRLHAQGKSDEPLQGYELYEKDLETNDMSFVGRTDWDGRLVLEKSDSPLRLMYVKNGGAVLARLPCVPGQDPIATADLMGDDPRLQAEAYIRGVQNAIIDLVALRELLSVRIRLRIEKGNVVEARELLESLREQPTYEILSTDMRNKRLELGAPSRQQTAMIDQLFKQTFDMLGKHIDERIIRQLEVDVANAEEKARNGAAKKPAEEPAEEPKES